MADRRLRRNLFGWLLLTALCATTCERSGPPPQAAAGPVAVRVSEVDVPPAAGTTAASEALPGQGRKGASPLEFEVPPPPFSEGIFPCSDCHEDMEVDRTRRKLEEEHAEIVLRHDEEHRWCLDCHDAENRDKLRLAGGELVDFKESYRLCGQCHGDKYRDWRAGVHGKRTGRWDGEKRYLLCAHCHNPHAPRFAPIAPLPAPVRPEEIR